MQCLGCSNRSGFALGRVRGNSEMPLWPCTKAPVLWCSGWVPLLAFGFALSLVVSLRVTSTARFNAGGRGFFGERS